MEIGTVLTLDNNKKYVVVDSINYVGKVYLFLTEENENEVNIMICEYNNSQLNLVEDEELIKTLTEKFMEKQK